MEGIRERPLEGIRERPLPVLKFRLVRGRIILSVVLVVQICTGQRILKAIA